jgi:DNA repair photolyase
MSSLVWRGRGALSNPNGRFEVRQRGALDADAVSDFALWDDDDEDRDRRPRTLVTEEHCKTIVSHNDSPDIPFERSLNPYRGCEHGCVYCFARPSHGYWGWSSGLDFETRIVSKPNAATVLRTELAKPGYRCEPFALGANTDPYQPLERTLGVTRSLLEVLQETRHPVGVVTKGHGVLRDTDLLAELAQDRLAHVYVSITTLDHDLARRLEPRASAPHRRLAAIERLAASGIPVGVLVSPVIPGLNDAEVERILEAAREAGATRSGSLLLRLPHEVKDLFVEWLRQHYPDRAERVLARIRECVNGSSEPEGRLYNPAFGARMRGVGVYAELLRQRYELAAQRLGFFRTPYPFDTTRFVPPAPALKPSRQLPLFPVG